MHGAVLRGGKDRPRGRQNQEGEAGSTGDEILYKLYTYTAHHRAKCKYIWDSIS